MAFRMIPDPEEDKAYAQWLMEQGNPQPPAFAPLYTDPAKNPIALGHGAPEPPAYGSTDRPRMLFPDQDPPGVAIAPEWQQQRDTMRDLYSGATEPGNIDLWHRPNVKNADGTSSSVRSLGVNIDGREVLIPTVSPDGRILSDDDAIALYKRTGQHLGVYPSVDASNDAGRRIHEQQAALPSARAARPPAQTASSDTGSTPSPMLNRGRTGGGDVHVMDAPMRSTGGGSFMDSDDAGMMLALFGDMAVNRGRGGGDILKFYQGAPDRELDREYKKAQIANQYAQATRPYGGRGMTPEQLELQRLRIDQADRRLGNQEAEAKGKIDEAARKRDPESAESRSAQDAAISAGVDPERVRGKTAEQILTWRPQYGQGAQQLRSNEAWQEHFSNTQHALNVRDDKLEGWKVGHEERAAERDYGKETRTAQRDERKAHAAAAVEYASKHKMDLSMAGLIDDLDKIPGGAGPQTLSERIKSSLGSWGVDASRMDAWQAKKLITEMWGRQQSGAAISPTEDENFSIQTGSSPTASNAQIDAAFRAVKRVLARNLAAGATGNPDAARDVAENAGLDPDRWIPMRHRSQPRRAAASRDDLTDDDVEDL